MSTESMLSDDALLEALSSVSTEELFTSAHKMIYNDEGDNKIDNKITNNQQDDNKISSINNNQRDQCDQCDEREDEINDNLELINLFIKKYNQKRGIYNSMFDGIDEKDPTSTTEQMEIFYGYMDEYKDLEAIDSNFVDVYDEQNFVTNPDHSAYAIINEKDMSIVCISMSYLSLLRFGYDSMRNVNEWNIIKL